MGSEPEVRTPALPLCPLDLVFNLDVSFPRSSWTQFFIWYINYFIFKKPLSLIHIGSWENSPFPLLVLWGNKNGLPSVKVKKWKKFQNKIGLKGCKWSSLKAPGTETPLSHPFLELGEFPFLIISPLG